MSGKSSSTSVTPYIYNNLPSDSFERELSILTREPLPTLPSDTISTYLPSNKNILSPRSRTEFEVGRRHHQPRQLIQSPTRSTVPLIGVQHRDPRTYVPTSTTVVGRGTSSNVIRPLVTSPIHSGRQITSTLSPRIINASSQPLALSPVRTNRITSPIIHTMTNNLPLSPRTAIMPVQQTMVPLSPVRRRATFVTPTIYRPMPIVTNTRTFVETIPKIRNAVPIITPINDVTRRARARVATVDMRKQDNNNDIRQEYMYEIGLKARSVAKMLNPLARNNFLQRVFIAYERDPNKGEQMYHLARDDVLQNGPTINSLQHMLQNYNRNEFPQ